MKMKVFGFLAFALLSISILSFGLTGAVNAQSDGLTLPLICFNRIIFLY
jgi:hypothetical protein